MNILGVHLTVLMGRLVPSPVPAAFAEALESVSVTHDDEGHSGFQITFQAGRSGLPDLLDYPLLRSPLLKPFNRVLLLVRFAIKPLVLMDGVITDLQLSPGADPGTGTLTVTGEDVSVMMDLEERPVEHPGQNDKLVAEKIILSYPQYGLKPETATPPALDTPPPTERTPNQVCTDLAHLRKMAKRHGFLFYVTPGPEPGFNTAHWGPPVRLDLPQRALSANMGPATNVESISFDYDAQAPTLANGMLLDPFTNKKLKFQTMAGTRLPLARQAAIITQKAVRRRWFTGSVGSTFTQALARAQGATNASTDNTVTASGELDAVRYGDLLRPRGLVGVRGVGFSFDGTYYVKSVTHNIQRGQYRQSFALTREGIGALSPVVIP